MRARAASDRGHVILAILAVALGLAVAGIDAQPHWDDTGITVGLLLLAAAGITAVAGDRPSLWALLVGLPLPIIEIATEGATASLIALTFAAVGAGIGWLVRRSIEPATAGTRN